MSQRASKEAVQFIKSILVPLPNLRLSASDTLELPWLQAKLVSPVNDIDEFLEHKEPYNGVLFEEPEHALSKKYESPLNIISKESMPQFRHDQLSRLTSEKSKPTTDSKSSEDWPFKNSGPRHDLSPYLETVKDLTGIHSPNAKDNNTEKAITYPTTWSYWTWDAASNRYFSKRYSPEGVLEIKYQDRLSNLSRNSEPRISEYRNLGISLL